jgi:hypothetical protein
MEPNRLSIGVGELEVGKDLPDSGADKPVVRVLRHRTTNARPAIVVPRRSFAPAAVPGDSEGRPGCRSAGKEEAVMPREIERAGVRQLLDQGAQLVEVLPAEEFKEDHLPGAISVPLRHIDAEGVSALDKDRPVIVYCWDSA